MSEYLNVITNAVCMAVVLLWLVVTRHSGDGELISRKAAYWIAACFAVRLGVWATDGLTQGLLVAVSASIMLCLILSGLKYKPVRKP